MRCQTLCFVTSDVRGKRIECIFKLLHPDIQSQYEEVSIITQQSIN